MCVAVCVAVCWSAEVECADDCPSWPRGHDSPFLQHHYGSRELAPEIELVSVLQCALECVAVCCGVLHSRNTTKDLAIWRLK